tara:strand:- start:239 stop:550 length:312 start_codon:yes stop_codon:yes gene_type:complete
MSAQYFAQINDNNFVTKVAVVQQEFLEANPQRYTGRWVETFIDNTHTYAGIGFEYLESEQDFRPAQPFPSWSWSNKNWNPPTPMPSTGGPYKWSEEELAWVAV